MDLFFDSFSSKRDRRIVRKAMARRYGAFGGGPGSLLIGGDLAGTVGAPTVQSSHFKGVPFFDVKAYGAVGDGVTNDTAAITAAIAAAAAAAGAVFVPAGNYKVTTLKITNGVRAFYGDGILVDSGVVGNGVLCLDGPNVFGGTAVSDCYVSISISLVNGALKGIFCDRALRCTFDSCRMSGFTDVNAAGCFGFAFWFGSKGNIVRGSSIIFPSGTPVNPQYGIGLLGNTSTYAGYFPAGAVDEPTLPCEEFVIADNYVFGGSHGISMNGAYSCAVTGNVLDTQRDRSIILEPCCRHNTIAGNSCKDFKSSAICMSFNSAYNDIVGNVCRSLIANGEAAIQGYLGVTNCLIANNLIEANPNYGIYLACGIQYCKVVNNQISLYRLAAIALESDWETPLPGAATYSRPNTIAPPVGTVWTFANTQLNEIRGNTILDSLGGNQCGIYLGQLLATYALTENVIADNAILTSGITMYLMVFEETSGKAINNKLIGTTFFVWNAAKISFSRNARVHFKLIDGNEGFNIGSAAEVSFPNAATTPDVSVGSLFTCANAGATSITAFINGAQGQEILVRLDSNTTIVHNNSFIRLKGSVNATGNSNSFIRFRQLANIWFEISRSF